MLSSSVSLRASGRVTSVRTLYRQPVAVCRGSKLVARAGDRISKSDLEGMLVEECQLDKKTAKRVLDTLLDIIIDEVADGNEVALIGFGTFKARDRAAREGRNPKTGEPLKIPAMKVGCVECCKDGLPPPARQQ